MKHCKDCRHFDKDFEVTQFIWQEVVSMARCEHPNFMNEDPVTGTIHSDTKCHMARNQADCGIDAKLFELK